MGWFVVWIYLDPHTLDSRREAPWHHNIEGLRGKALPTDLSMYPHGEFSHFWITSDRRRYGRVESGGGDDAESCQSALPPVVSIVGYFELSSQVQTTPTSSGSLVVLSYTVYKSETDASSAWAQQVDDFAGHP
jgi:hypothetical protein